jgi:hypothetical protein
VVKNSIAHNGNILVVVSPLVRVIVSLKSPVELGPVALIHIGCELYLAPVIEHKVVQVGEVAVASVVASNTKSKVAMLALYVIPKTIHERLLYANAPLCHTHREPCIELLSTY